MNIDLNTSIGALAAFITVLGGAWTSIRLVISSSKRKKEKYKEDILNQAREEIAKIEFGLEEKIKGLELDLEAHKESVSKDFGFLKETYSNEFKNLSEKIELMRDQLNAQHTQLISLLTHLVDSK